MMESAGNGGLEAVVLVLDQWSLLERKQPFDTREEAENYIRGYSPKLEFQVTEIQNKFYIWFKVAE